MTSAAELGISEQEFQDAMNLEKIYALVSKAGRCSKCSNTPTHVDCSAFQFLCSSHAVGRANCKKIGDDRFGSFEVDKLQRKYGGGGSTSRASHSSPPAAPIRSSRSDKHQRGRSKHRKRRSPSPEPSDESSSDSEYDYTPPKTRSRKPKPASKTQQFSSAFDEDFGQQQQQQPLPGMAGILMQQQKLSGFGAGGFGGMQPGFGGSNYMTNQGGMPGMLGMGQPGISAGGPVGYQSGGFHHQQLTSNKPPSMMSGMMGQPHTGGMMRPAGAMQPRPNNPFSSTPSTPNYPDASGSFPFIQQQFSLEGRPQAGLGAQYPGFGHQPGSQAGFGSQASGFGNQPSGFGSQLSGFGNQPSGFGNQPSGFGSQLSGFGNQPSGFGNQLSGFGNQPSGFASQPSGFASQPSGFSGQPAGFGSQQFGFGHQAGLGGQQAFGQQFGAQQGRHPFASTGNLLTAKGQYGMFNSMQGIPNPSASQRDWWE